MKLLCFVLLLVSATTRAQFPVHIEAEDYAAANGVNKDACAEGGSAVLATEYDWLDYNINLPQDSIYNLTFRLAGTGGEVVVMDSATDGWRIAGKKYWPDPVYTFQHYTNISVDLFLKGGARKIRIMPRNGARLNINWLQIRPTNLICVNSFDSDWEWGHRGIPNGSPGLPWRADRCDSASNTLMPYGWIKQTARPQSLTISNYVSRKGRSHARFELAKTDTSTWPYVRAEIYHPAFRYWEYYIGFSFNSPTYITGNPHRCILWQAHSTDDAWDGGKSPSVAMELRVDSFRCKLIWGADTANTNANKDGEAEFNLGPYTPNLWIDWVIHVNFAWDSTGVVEIWRNGIKVLDYHGPCAWNDKKPPYMKFGIYNWALKGGNPPWALAMPFEVQVCEYDEIRIGGPSSSYNEVRVQ